MRQRRQGLQVSTFPFLAVLLCAMGALILLLLVIDRRAKAVARAKAMRARDQAMAQATAEEERAAAAHRAEWERRRQVLHEQLLQQDQLVLGELQAVRGKDAAAAGRVEAEFAHSRDLQEQLQAERARLARSEEELTARRAEVANTAGQDEASRAERARLTTELERMERTLADLKAARQRQQQMYSLVPYRGKRGDSRKPLYIECTGDELIFHPDRLTVHGLTPLEIRGEIERRLARQRSQTKAVNDKPEEDAYLLMLIRPNGITTYYRTLAALKGLKLDFGYEFIEQDWILDFSQDGTTPAEQPWRVADQTKEKQPSDPAVKKVQAPGTSVTGRPQRRSQGLPSGGAVSGRPAGVLASGSAGPGDPPFGGGGVGASRQGDLGPVSAGSSTVSARPAPVQPLGQGEPSFRSGGAAEGADIGQPFADGQRGTRGQPSDNRAPPSTGGGAAQTEGSTRDPSKPGIEAPPSLLPPLVPNRARATANLGVDASQVPASDGTDRGGPSRGQASPGGPAQGAAGEPRDRLAAQNPPLKPVRAVPLRPGSLVGNRDWIIPIECTADALVLHPSGQRIAAAELSKGDNGNNPLLERVQQMIARRQTAVRPGEPPYRPLIRFRVWPDGLRSYHLAYPALEPLRVPMTRENLEPEDVKPASGGR